MSKTSREALVLFSGGSDSTLAAALLAERFDKVTLLTLDRLSFVGAKDFTKTNYNRLVKIYGPNKIKHVILPVGKYHKQVCYNNYLYFASKYRLAVVAMSFSKLSMHWRAAEYCLDNNIQTVADGMVPYMQMYTDQNEEIAIKRLKNFYKEFGITYENPVYKNHKNTEEQLYNRGITNQPVVRGTKSDHQVYYAEQVLFALFLKYYLTLHGKKKYEEIVGNIYQEKIDYIKSCIKERQIHA